jgi:ATP diphosphatase
VEKKFSEEWSEFVEARKRDDRRRMEEEFGDALFVLVNLGRWLDINAELALNKTVQKFIRRFQYIEEKLAEKGKTPYESNLAEMDAIWNEAKDKKGILE